MSVRMPRAALAALWNEQGLPGAWIGQLDLAGADPVPSSFAVGEAAHCAVALSALAAAALHEARTGVAQRVHVDRRHAFAAFRSEQIIRLDGRPVPEPPTPIAGLYPARDGWVRLHTNFPHHEAGVLRLLDVARDRSAVAAALRAKDSLAFEQEAADAGLCVTALRSFAAWDAHPQGQAVPTLPLVRITRLSDAQAGLPPGAAPMGGLRVLDLTRVIAGPVGTRTLAAHGADVLTVTGPGLPCYRIEDLGRGKRQASVDLRTQEGRDRLRSLAADADVFVQGYRPGAIAGTGFSPKVLHTLRPGLVTASLSAYGAAGPWAGRRGFDSLVQTASGFNHAEAEAFGETAPRPLPAQALDHATGYLLAFGIMAALHRRATIGGGWHVEVSLARTGHWLRGLGRTRPGGAVPGFAELGDLMETTPSGFGEMTALRHPAILSQTPACWMRPSVPPGSDAASWT
jgi:crotonobetainyl-CoA:carnitine CoA-transferase CaiB-like acyl-CoA transferase